LVWFGLVWFGSVWFGLVWFGLVWFGLVWFDLVWFRSVWFGLIWFGLISVQHVWFLFLISVEGGFFFGFVDFVTNRMSGFCDCEENEKRE